uniref:Uncharacterized protein n=3 Tax=Physcomitrium patens TaxID=3218 RepID=A0A2K1KV02_PHYPA|nr:uncharacterized protein LOC112280234 [Physcomitrium patens]PNR57609.1 hypothetical protein PHYPA_004603 [Physcomitrium patens]|eukprot:XP_024371251.1 uncharacterized protein LOC112280234 [Physcomitrella patens]
MLDTSLFGNEDTESILEERDCGFKSSVHALNLLACDADDKSRDFFKLTISGWRHRNKPEPQASTEVAPLQESISKSLMESTVEEDTCPPQQATGQPSTGKDCDPSQQQPQEKEIRFSDHPEHELVLTPENYFKDIYDAICDACNMSVRDAKWTYRCPTTDIAAIILFTPLVRNYHGRSNTRATQSTLSSSASSHIWNLRFVMFARGASAGFSATIVHSATLMRIWHQSRAKSGKRIRILLNKHQKTRPRGGARRVGSISAHG